MIPPSDYEFIEKLAYKYFLRSSYYVELDDLIQEGVIAYLKARKKYDVNKNNFFMGYAYLRVSGAIKDYIGKNSPKGGATVRPNSVKSTREVYTFSEAGIELDELYDNSLSPVEEQLIVMEANLEFKKYLETLNSLEQRILYDYFILQFSIVKVSERYKISRVKIKKILTSCLEHLKSFFGISTIIED
jgi:RNA polymerase sigma factor (sigma-70 family)